jgi:hypothetical protein
MGAFWLTEVAWFCIPYSLHWYAEHLAQCIADTPICQLEEVPSRRCTILVTGGEQSYTFLEGTVNLNASENGGSNKMIAMNMFWKGMTRDQYQAARNTVRWETDVPKGAMFHVASFGEDGMYCSDVWESAEDFGYFMEKRLKPAFVQLGFQGQPEVTITPVHAVFAPAYTMSKAA